MGTRQLVYTATGTEAASAVLASGVLPAFSAPYTFTISRTGPTTSGYTFQYVLVNGNTSTTCLTYNTGIGSGAATFSEPAVTPGGSGLTWHCTNWTLWQVKNWFTTQHLDAGAVYTFSITAADLADPPACAYGTQPAPTSSLVTLITDAAVTAALSLWGAPWLSVLFDPLIGYALDTGVLCGTGPPAVSTITPQSLLEDVGSKVAALEAIMWYSICQCAPAPSGQPPPTPYTPPPLTQPPGWPARPGYTCTDADVCATLLLILKRLDELSGSQQIAIDQRTTVINPLGRLSYTPGSVHTGLTGTGSFAIAGLVGVRVEITGGSPPLVLAGNPPYQWDRGWMSVTDGGALLLERRIARDSAEWFPPEMQLATQFGYSLTSGVVVTMTELLPNP